MTKKKKWHWILGGIFAFIFVSGMVLSYLDRVPAESMTCSTMRNLAERIQKYVAKNKGYPQDLTQLPELQNEPNRAEKNSILAGDESPIFMTREGSLFGLYSLDADGNKNVSCLFRIEMRDDGSIASFKWEREPRMPQILSPTPSPKK